MKARNDQDIEEYIYRYTVIYWLYDGSIWS